MSNDDTIVAIATANSTGSISVVRVSGENALPIALKLSKRKNLKSRFATLSFIYNSKNEIIDEVILIYFKNPFSFTAEDVVEFQCHGGVAISNIIVDEIIKCGARIAQAGEFSKRAFLNGKIDLSKAEAIAKIIEAKSEDAVKLLARQLKGELSQFVNDIREDLLFMLAYTEVNIDYAEEDLPNDIFEQIENKLAKIKTNLADTIDISKRREGLIEGFKVAIIGKPNVGKSSLLNKFLNFDRAIISNIAGTTRDTIEEYIKIGTHIIKIVDTAGIRDSNDKIEQIGIKKSIKAINDAHIIICIFDNGKTLDNEDKKILALLKNNPSKEIIKVLNKIDLENKFDKTKLENFIELSAKKTIKPLISKIKSLLDLKSYDNDMILTSKRQINSVEQTLFHINESSLPLQRGELEFFAYHLTQALENISNITRPYENDEMLDLMFGTFCLGK